MVKYATKQLLLLIPKLLIISLAVFLVLQALPGDPISRSVPLDVYKYMNETQLEALRESLGLNRPWYMQYFSWLGNMLQGNFGYSQVNGSDVGQLIADRLPATMALAAFALIIGNLLGLLFGYLAATHQNSWLDYSSTTVSVVGISVPQFFFSIIILMLFAVKLRWFPTGGRLTPGDGGFWDRINHMILPGLCMALGMVCNLMRYTRGSMLDVMNKDYVKTARSKGIAEWKVNLKHTFRNALIPVMTTLIFRLVALVGGTVIIETIFSYPGMGAMIMDALSGGDMPVVMVCTMLTSFVALCCSCLLDTVTAALDPRVRLD